MSSGHPENRHEVFLILKKVDFKNLSFVFNCYIICMASTNYSELRCCFFLVMIPSYFMTKFWVLSSLSTTLFFSLFFPASWSDSFSRSPPPEPAPHDPALLVYKQRHHHVINQSNRAFNQAEADSSSCNLSVDHALLLTLKAICTRPDIII